MEQLGALMLPIVFSSAVFVWLLNQWRTRRPLIFQTVDRYSLRKNRSLAREARRGGKADLVLLELDLVNCGSQAIKNERLKQGDLEVRFTRRPLRAAIDGTWRLSPGSDQFSLSCDDGVLNPREHLRLKVWFDGPTHHEWRHRLPNIRILGSDRRILTDALLAVWIAGVAVLGFIAGASDPPVGRPADTGVQLPGPPEQVDPSTLAMSIAIMFVVPPVLAVVISVAFSRQSLRVRRMGRRQMCAYEVALRLLPPSWPTSQPHRRRFP
jgi:hypothetical protein